MQHTAKEKNSRAVRILIADDHPIFRDGLRRLLDSEPEFQVIGQASNGVEAVNLARQMKPDILLLDLAMPLLTGLNALRELAKVASPVHTILLTAAIDKPEIIEALQLGARGIVLKDSATELLLKSIRTVMAGQYWVGRESVSDLVKFMRQPTPAPSGRSKNFGLTKRELQVVAAIVEGYSNKEIAQKFSLSEDTVKHHLTNIFNKAGVSNRLELALFAINHRLIEGIA